MNPSSTPSVDVVIDVKDLSRRFDFKLALDQVSLAVPRGCVFGLVGENGAGKTTLIKHLLGLLKAEAGSVRVFGRDPVADPVGVLGRVGYKGDLCIEREAGNQRVEDIRAARKFVESL